MISINKIREKSGLLIVIIGLAMGAFILGDFFSSGNSFTPRMVGEVNGESIEGAYFEAKVEEQLNGYRQTNRIVNDQITQQVRAQVWNGIIRDKVLMGQLDEVGLSISEEEYDDVRFGNNIMPSLKGDQSFINPETGAFDPASVRQYYSVLQERYPSIWKEQRDAVLAQRKITKYNNLIAKSLYVNNLQTEADYVAANQKVDLAFVVKKFASVNDSLVTVTEADVRKYYNEHKSDKKYKQENSRSIDYVLFPIAPSAEDRKSLKNELSALVEQFKIAESDSAFVVENSDNRFYNPQVYTEGSTAANIDSLITNGSKGDVVGPYEDGGLFKLSKIVLNGKAPEVNARHILLKPVGNQTVEDVKAIADSLKKVIKKNKNFAELAQQLSEDKGSGSKGGDLDWFGEGMMVAPFNDACFNGKKGDMPIVETQFGIHLIEITDTRSVDQIKLANITRAIEASTSTVDAVYDEASMFSINNNTAETFVSGAEEKGYQTRTASKIKPQDKFVAGIQKPEALIRWVNKAEIGTVSEPVEADNNFVVAVLTKVTAERMPTFEDVKDQMELEVIKEKKAAYIKNMIKGTDVQTVAQELGVSVQNAANISFSSTVIPSGGRELGVIGTALTLAESAVSKPIVGENGVYVLSVTKKTEAPKVADYNANKRTLASKYENRVNSEAYAALVDKANVKDERFKVY